MCNKDALVSYLYDDLEPAARLAFEQHLHACLECRDELAAMRGVRADLLTWSPPEPDFAFRLVAESREAQAARVLRPDIPSWRAWFTPAAGFAAAAVLVLAAAAGLARVEVTTGADGWTIRTGVSGQPAADTVAGLRVGRTGSRDVNLRAPGPDAMTVLEERVAALEAVSRDAASVRSASMQNARASNDDVLTVVRELLAQSETRQKGELALRIAQVIRDVDMKRAADLNGVRQGLVRMDANMTEEAAAHRELMNYILTNSRQQK
jgi:anti-sigma factor RsiW